MSTAISAPAQPKQPSRKGKKAWRKNVDISSIQTGLEALREEMIQGGPLSEKPSDELFALDTTGSSDIKNKYKLTKPLKVDEILAKRSAVPAVDGRKRGRVGDGILDPPSKRAKQDWVSKKEVSRLRAVADRTSHLDGDLVAGEDGTVFDLWGGEVENNGPSEYVPKPKQKTAPASIKRAPQPITANGKPVKAVKKPIAGTSYNPQFEDWDDLLNRAGEAEIAAEKARVAREQAEAERQARIAASAAEDEANRTDHESEWEGFETEGDEPETLRLKRPRRKTQAERNKINRRKELERMSRHESRTSEKQKIAELAVTNMLALAEKGEGEGGLVLAQEQSEEDSDSGDDTKLRRRKLGNQVVMEKSLELVLPEELQESLRQLKPEGNLLQDRFRNLLVNGKIESRKPVLQPKKKKTKATEKWSHKDFSVVV